MGKTSLEFDQFEILFVNFPLKILMVWENRKEPKGLTQLSKEKCTAWKTEKNYNYCATF